MTVLLTVLAVIGWILLGVLALLLLVLFTPIGIRIHYTDSWFVKFYICGWLPVYRLNDEKISKMMEKTSDTVQEEPTSEESETSPPKVSSADTETKEEATKSTLLDDFKRLYKQQGVKGVIAFFKQLLSIVTGTCRKIVPFITVKDLQLCIRIGDKTADKTAVRYGQVCAALFPTLSALTSLLRLRKTAVQVQPDFLQNGTDVRLRMVLWIWPFGVVWHGLIALVKMVLLWMKLPKERATSVTENHKKL